MSEPTNKQIRESAIEERQTSLERAMREHLANLAFAAKTYQSEVDHINRTYELRLTAIRPNVAEHLLWFQTLPTLTDKREHLNARHSVTLVNSEMNDHLALNRVHRAVHSLPH